MISNVDARMVFDNAKRAITNAFNELTPGAVVQYTKLTQSTYRFEQLLVAGTTHYTFNVLQNTPLITNTEQRLLQQDSAVIYSIGVFTAAPASANDAAFLLDAYPSPVKYGANAAPLNALYNGYLKITVNNDILVPNWDLWKHLCVPETQQTAALGAGSPQDEIFGESYGFYPMEPNVVLIGSKNNVIEINLPVGITAVQANSRVVCIVRCITAQNSTVVS